MPNDHIAGVPNQSAHSGTFVEFLRRAGVDGDASIESHAASHDSRENLLQSSALSAPLEVERKFLVRGEIPRDAIGASITQGYLSIGDPEVRIRIKDGNATLTVKSKVGGQGVAISRAEVEIKRVALDTATALMEIAPYRLTKTRYVFGAWEIDRFGDALDGLVMAEFELPEGARHETDLPAFPEWVTDYLEVSSCVSFENRNLATLAPGATAKLLSATWPIGLSCSASLIGKASAYTPSSQRCRNAGTR